MATVIYSGGISNWLSSPIISNNIITDNSAYYFGSGIWNYGNSAPNISNNTISNNQARYSQGNR